MTNDLPEMAFEQWPSDRARPTPEEIEAARVRWKEFCHPDDMTDFSFDFGFMMTTYNSLMWLGFFFPEEAKEFQRKFADSMKNISWEPPK